MAVFKLRKWKSSSEEVLSSIPKGLTDPKTTQEITLENDYTKVLGVEWNAVTDCFPTYDLLVLAKNAIDETSASI